MAPISRSQEHTAPAPPSSATMNSITFKASSAVVKVHSNIDMTITAEANDADYAIEDSRAVFSLIRPHLRVLSP